MRCRQCGLLRKRPQHERDKMDAPHVQTERYREQQHCTATRGLAITT
jgi:hypothetical protein